MTTKSMTDETTIPFDHAEPPRLFGLRRSALVELALFFGVFLLVDMLFLDGTRLREVSPHPFWIAILLVSAQYGINEGLLAAFVASAVLLVGNLPSQELSQDMYAYLFSICINPLMWIPMALSLGALRTRQIRDRGELREAVKQSKQESEALAQAYERLSRITAKLESRLAGKDRTVLSAFRAASLLAHNDEKQVLEGVADAVKAVLHPHRFSLFLARPKGLKIALRIGWERMPPLERWFDGSTDLYRHIVHDGGLLCVANPWDEKVLEDQGLLAGPVADPATGACLGMLKIEGMDFLDLNEETVDLFRVLCDWIGMALARARDYETARASSFHTENPRLYSDTALEPQVSYFEKLGGRFDLDMSMIVVNPLDTQSMVSADRRQLVRVFGEAVEECLRDTDVAFECRRRGPRFVIILVGASEELGFLVSRRLSETVQRRLPARLGKLQIKYHVKAVESEHG